MAQELRTRFLCVGVIAENRLAAACLLAILRHDPSLVAFPIEDAHKHSRRILRNLVVVVDNFGLSLPFTEWLARVKSSFPQARFLALDQELERGDVVLMLSAGAHGFLPHDQASRYLVRAVRFVSEGHYWVKAGVLEDYLRQVSRGLRGTRNGDEQFTPREFQVLELVRRRLSNKEIASCLSIRVSTVKFHLSNILAKQHVSSRQELFRQFHWDLWPAQGAAPNTH